VFRCSVDEALYISPTLAKLPFASLGVDGVVELDTAAPGPGIPRGCAFMAWGGNSNYGHFLIDCLTTLLVEKELGLLSEYPAMMPSHLSQWHRDLIRLTVGDVPVVVIDSPIVYVDDIVFGNPMAHFLHAPNALIKRLGTTIVNNCPSKSPLFGCRIYLSRRGNPKREMLNEADIEAALLARGFDIVHPESLPVEDQILAISQAEIIVGAAGAAFANCLFASPKTVVVEIQPINFTGIWVRNICDELDLIWSPFFCQSPIDERQLIIEGVPRHGGGFSYVLPPEDFLAHLDSFLKG
jgi:capsular polysaccharide biosynthesis protein